MTSRSNYTRAGFRAGPWHLVDESERSETIRGPLTVCGCEIKYFWETVTEEEAAAESRKYVERLHGNADGLEPGMVTPFCSNCTRVEVVRNE